MNVNNWATRLALAALVGVSYANAASIYVFSSGYPVLDTQVMSALQAEGHDPYLGQRVDQFNNFGVINGFEAVYYQPNYYYSFNWSAAQEQAFVDYVNGGGGIVTAEWAVWMAGVGYNQTIKQVFPSVETSSWDSATSITYTRTTPNSIMDAGVPTSFTTNTSNIAGVRTHVAAVKAGATVFYSDGAYKAVTGWGSGNGRVVNFHTVNGENQLANSAFRRLLANSFDWVVANPPTGPGVTGDIEFEDWAAADAPNNAAFLYFNSTYGIGAGRVAGTLTSSGGYTIPGPNVPGTYRLFIKASHWLRASTIVLTSAGGTFSADTVTLVNGDCDGDNEIGPGDFSVLSSAFGSMPGDGNWNYDADLDGDEEVGPSDFAVLTTNFGETGE